MYTIQTMNYYSCLDTESDTENIVMTFQNRKNIKEYELDHKDVERLYKYFEYIGKCIGKEHIYASLRRNFGDINKAGKDLDNILINSNVDITLNSNNYLIGQEWQINPHKGMYLIYEDTAYLINCVRKLDNCIVLDKVLLRKYDDKRIYMTDDDVKYGKYKLLLKEDLQDQLEKEYKKLCDDLKNMYEDDIKWCKKLWNEVSKCEQEILHIQNIHDSTCTSNAKLKTFIHANLPIELISKIKEYGLESKCSHLFDINEIRGDIEYIEEIIDNGYEPYEELKWNKEIAYHVLIGDYDEWLDDY